MGFDAFSPTIAPGSINTLKPQDEHWRNFGNSVDAVSFGFVATAILISMFLIMALLEKFLRPRSTPNPLPNFRDLESSILYSGKLHYPSPKTNIYSREVSVLMPGEEMPTFIANPAPAPAPCPPERFFQPLNQHFTFRDTIHIDRLREGT